MDSNPAGDLTNDITGDGGIPGLGSDDDDEFSVDGASIAAVEMTSPGRGSSASVNSDPEPKVVGMAASPVSTRSTTPQLQENHRVIPAAIQAGVLPMVSKSQSTSQLNQHLPPGSLTPNQIEKQHSNVASVRVIPAPIKNASGKQLDPKQSTPLQVKPQQVQQAEASSNNINPNSKEASTSQWKGPSGGYGGHRRNRKRFFYTNLHANQDRNRALIRHRVAMGKEASSRKNYGKVFYHKKSEYPYALAYYIQSLATQQSTSTQPTCVGSCVYHDSSITQPQPNPLLSMLPFLKPEEDITYRKVRYRGGKDVKVGKVGDRVRVLDRGVDGNRKRNFILF
ncbi:hypothetical protein HDU76_007837 [Blyttiomyces sp. JEL0837]|nr:hypothetical protein HDU76_007837 [Blyttiomyces sp. JEL0837]